MEKLFWILVVFFKLLGNNVRIYKVHKKIIKKM